LKLVRDNLREQIQICKNNFKSSTSHEVTESLKRNQVPKKWNKYHLNTVTVQAWITDFKGRLTQIEHLETIENLWKASVSLDMVLSPANFLTATRQFVALKHENLKWSIEELVLRLIMIPKGEEKAHRQEHPESFLIKDLLVEGASYSAEDGKLTLSSTYS